jgi:hypothetical protein
MCRDALKMVPAPLPRNHHSTLDLRSPQPTRLASLIAGYYILSVNRERGRRDFTAEGAEGGAGDAEDEMLAVCSTSAPSAPPSATSAVNPFYLSRKEDSCAANRIG